MAAIERERPDLVFLCAPNNPTGTPVPLETIAAAYEATDGMVFVDEAYGEFMPSDAPSALTLLPGRERLIVSRTMSKAFAFAGARVGYLAADPAVTDAMRLVRLPYHLSALTQAAALGALAHAPEMLRMVDDICVQRDRTAARPRGPRLPRVAELDELPAVRRCRRPRRALACAARPRRARSATSPSPAACASPPAPRPRPTPS